MLYRLSGCFEPSNRNITSKLGVTSFEKSKFEFFSFIDIDSPCFKNCIHKRKADKYLSIDTYHIFLRKFLSLNDLMCLLFFIIVQ